MRHVHPTPCTVMHPQIIKFPPPCFTVFETCCEMMPPTLLQDFFHTHFRPSEPRRLIFVSSENITRFQSSSVQCWYLTANAYRCLIWVALSNGFFCFTADFIPSDFNTFRNVWVLTCICMVLLNSFCSRTAVSAAPEVTKRMSLRLSAADILAGRPPRCF